jgi:hypothetical protein
VTLRDRGPRDRRFGPVLASRAEDEYPHG